MLCSFNGSISHTKNRKKYLIAKLLGVQIIINFSANHFPREFLLYVHTPATVFFSKICKILKLRFSIKHLHKNTQLLVFFVF